MTIADINAPRGLRRACSDAVHTAVASMNELLCALGKAYEESHAPNTGGVFGPPTKAEAAAAAKKCDVTAKLLANLVTCEWVAKLTGQAAPAPRPDEVCIGTRSVGWVRPPGRWWWRCGWWWRGWWWVNVGGYVVPCQNLTLFPTRYPLPPRS